VKCMDNCWKKPGAAAAGGGGGVCGAKRRSQHVLFPLRFSDSDDCHSHSNNTSFCRPHDKTAHFCDSHEQHVIRACRQRGLILLLFDDAVPTAASNEIRRSLRTMREP
jgi:hypothetical protein